MLNIIYCFILTLNIFLLFIKRKPKIILPIDFAFVFILFYGTTATNDYPYYVLMYEQGVCRTSYEVGFNLLLDVIKMTGLSFQGFMGAVWVIFGGILVYIFSRYSKNYPLFFSCYLIYILFIDIVQLKSFCASVLLLCAFRNYFKGKKVLYAVFNVLAATVHLEVIFFLPLVLFNSDNLKSRKFIKRCGEIIMALCVVFFFAKGALGSAINWIGSVLSSAMGTTDKMGYFTTTTNFGFLLYFGLHFVIMLSTYYGKCKLYNNGKKCSKNGGDDIISKVQLIQFYCLFAFPLIMVNMNFYRLYRVTIFVSYIAWAIELDNFISTTVKYYKCLLGVLLSNAIYRIPIVHGNSQISVILDNNSIVGREF